MAELTAYLLQICVFFLIILTLQRVKKLHKYMSELPPGPWGLPLLGYLPWLDPKEPHITLTNLSKKYGKIFSMKLGNLTTIVLADPTLIKQAFSKDGFSGRADLFVTHGIMEGYGLIAAEGELWKQQRRFAVSTLKTFGMVKHGQKRAVLEKRIMVGVDDLLEKLLLTSGREVDLKEHLLHSVNGVMNSLVLGKIWSENDPTWIWLQSLIEKGIQMMQVAGPINFMPWLRFIPKYRRTIQFLVEGKLETHKLYEQIIQESSGDTQDFVSVYKKEMERREGTTGHSFTQQQCNHFLADIIGAGTDTTSTSLAWFFLSLVLHPHVKERIQAELDAVRKPDEKIQLIDMERTPYLRAAFAESLRIRPIVTIGIPHATTQDTLLAGYRIPKRSMVIPLLWAINLSPDYWPDPDKFEPCRFLDDDGNFFKPDVFMPFQVGKRMCLGDELSYMMTFLYCANILQKFNVTSPNTEEELWNSFQGDCGLLFIPKKYSLKFELRVK